MALISFSSQLDTDEFEKMTAGLSPIDEFAIPDELIEAGFTVQQSIELSASDGRKWFCTAYVRHEHRVVMAHVTESADSDVLSGEVYVFANADWEGLTAHW
ncbi:MAG: hypothetical protein IPM52_10645 [Bacteroidetes bacterium]|nr:hypothetical protein [Bacteroidota bacterium]